MSTSYEVQEIAQWMLKEYLRYNRLAQHSAAWHIRHTYGEKHLYKNANGNFAINKPILDAFKKIRPKDVVWSRGSQTWRKRNEWDKGDGVMVS